MISKFRHTGIVVRDLNKSLVFYEGLGFCLWKREVEEGAFIDNVVGLKGVCVETAKLKSPCGALLELLQYHSHKVNQKIECQPSNKLGCSHIALTVKCIKSALDLIKNMGGSIVKPPLLAPNGLVKVAYCHDSEGVLLELVEEV
tara:strand:- start:191 stop:622 length:432 start_codon:yes stop_codon:yes gene_type:complete